MRQASYRSLLSFAVLLLLAVLGWIPPAHAFLGQMYIYNTSSTTITIDGTATDWNANTMTHSVTGLTSECAKVRLSYNATYLYLLYEVKDSTPLLNSATDDRLILKGGDCVGITLGPYGTQGVNTRILFAKVAGNPVITMMRPTVLTGQTPAPYTYSSPVGSVTMNYAGPVTGASAALIPVIGGYVVEARIPWTQLGITPVSNGVLPADVQIIFSNPAGTMNDSTYWFASTGPGPKCVMDLPTEAQLYPNEWGTAKWTSTAIGPQGGRPVVVDDPSIGPGTAINVNLPSACKVSIVIKDSNGWIVRELVRARPETAGPKTYYWDGRDRQGKLLPAGKYTYLMGTFNGPSTSFYGSVGNSGHPPYRTPNGLGSIGGIHGGPMAVAADSGGIYMMNALQEGQKSGRKINVNGDPQWFYSAGTFCGFEAVAADGTYAYVIYTNNGPRTFQRLNATTGAVSAMSGVSAVTINGSAVKGMAITNGRAYYTVKSSNKIGVVNVTTGAVETSITITGPSGICKKDATSVLVCTETKVVSVDVTTGVSTDVITTDLVAPAAVTVDGSGNIYVADQGTSQQIKKFSSGGVLQGVYGVSGGRTYPQPVYNPLAFKNVSGLCLGPDGKIYGVEQSGGARRFFCITTGGLWQRDFYGPTGFSNAVVNLDDPTELYYQTEGASIFARATYDPGAYAANPSGNNTWTFQGLYNMTQNGIDGTASPDLMATDGGPSSMSYQHGFIFIGNNGKKYFWMRGPNRCGLWIWNGTTWQACAATRSKGQGSHMSWSDDNGDGLVQSSEFDTVDSPTFTWTGIDRNLKLYGQGGTWAPASIDAAGTPHYQGGTYTAHLAAGQPKLSYYFSQGMYSLMPSMTDADGAVYLVQNCGAEQGQGFWDRASEARLLKIQGGIPQWLIGHHNGDMVQPGDTTMLMGIAGVVDGVVLCSEVESNFMAYTTDGLTLGAICTKDTPTDIYVENAAQGLFIKDPNTGKRLVISMTTEDVRVLEVSGVFGTDITRTTGSVRIPTALPRTKEMSAHRPLPYSTWAYAYGGMNQGVDGHDWEWDKSVPGAPIYSNLDGILGDYFSDINFSTLKLTRVDPNINFNWGSGSPSTAAGVPVDNFGIRWSGMVEPQYSETYTFSGYADDKFRLYVDNQLVIDRWSAGGSGTGSIALQAGEPVSIVMEFRELYGNASTWLNWSSPSQASQTVPTSRLTPSGMVAEMRLRRDAGNLCVYADVLDSTPFPEVTGYASPAAHFGREDGIELLLGPAANPTRTTGGAGDIRIFLTATRSSTGVLTGYAYACKPGSVPVPTHSSLRPMANNGSYTGTAPAGDTNFSAGLVAIPGAMISIVERTDRQGYSLEAEIPWAMMREIAQSITVTAKRQPNNTTITPTRFDLLPDPIKFNSSVLYGRGDGTTDRFAWVPDGQNTTSGTVMNPSTWGWANDQVTISWPTLVGATSYNLYRSSTTNPANATLVASGMQGNSKVDIPGIGTFHYWLAAVSANGEGQWYGPVQARNGSASFAGYTNIEPYTYASIPALSLYMGKTQAVNINVDADTLTASVPAGLTVTTVKRSSTVWTAFVTASATRAAGTSSTITFTATKAGVPTNASLTVQGASLWTDAYMARGVDILRSIPENRLDLDSTKPADGAAGLPAANIDWAGTGVLTQRALGKHGYVLPRYRGNAGIVRNVKAPFVDTFTTDNFGTDDGLNSLEIWLDGVNGKDTAGQYRSGKVPTNTVGSNSTLRIETTDTNLPHLMTVLESNRMNGNNPAHRFEVKDLATNKTWVLADFPNGASRVAVQCEFTGIVNLIVKQMAAGMDGNARANIIGVLLD